MERHFEHDLRGIETAAAVDGQPRRARVHQSVQAVLDGEERLAEAVLGEEDAINEMQIEIDERVQRLLALQAPMATDLRFLLAVRASMAILSALATRLSTSRSPRCASCAIHR